MFLKLWPTDFILGLHSSGSISISEVARVLWAMANWLHFRPLYSSRSIKVSEVARFSLSYVQRTSYMMTCTVPGQSKSQRLLKSLELLLTDFIFDGLHSSRSIKASEVALVPWAMANWSHIWWPAQFQVNLNLRGCSRSLSYGQLTSYLTTCTVSDQSKSQRLLAFLELWPTDLLDDNLHSSRSI